jgi:hypothetical protein
VDYARQLRQELQVTPGHARRVRRAAAVGVTLTLAVPGLILTSESARADINFSGSASANAARMVVHASGAPVSQDPVDGGGPVAQALLDSNSTSQGFASFPYPGDLFLSAPALLPGLMAPYLSPYGLEFPAAPEYPFAVSSDWPTDSKDSAAQGPVTLDASSTATSSEGAASIAPPGSVSRGGRAVANVSRGDAGSVVASSQSELHGFTAGALTFSDIRSSARVVYDANGKLTRSSELHVTGLSAAGVQIDVRPAGLFVNGQEYDSSPVADVLKAAGITLGFLPEEKTENGVIGAALTVRRDQDFASAGTGYVTYIFGQSSAQVAGSVVPGAGGATGGGVGAGGGAEGSNAAPGSIQPGSGSAAGLVGASGETDLAGTPGLIPSAPQAVGVPGTTNLVPVTTAAQSSAIGPERLELGGLYAVLAFAVGVGILAATLVRRLGVRSS